MDTVTLVSKHIEDGEKLIKQLSSAGIDVRAALWLKTSEASVWYLYIVSPIVDDEGPNNAYGRLQPILRNMPPPYSLDPLAVKVIGVKNPIAKEVIDIVNRYSEIMPMHYHAPQLGGVSIDGAYIYSLS